VTCHHRRHRPLTRQQRQAAGAAVAIACVFGAAHGAASSVQDPPAASSASVPGNVALGQRLASGYGWGSGSQWGCLYDLWDRESGWSNTAENASDAYGIAQALGHGPSNQYPAGPANPPVSSASAQIRWGLGYIQATYETPCGAWGHEEADGWY
jgi:hypothetical protein